MLQIKASVSGLLYISPHIPRFDISQLIFWFFFYKQINQLEKDMASVEKENSDLHRRVATLQHSADKLERLEQELSDLEVENRKLQKNLEALQSEFIFVK